MVSESESWSETPIFEGVRNYRHADALFEKVMVHQAVINVKCKTMSFGMFHERSPLHLAIDEFLPPDIISFLVSLGAQTHSIMTEIKDGSISCFDCSQRLEYIRAACNHPLTGEAEKLAHLHWCGRSFSQEWCITFTEHCVDFSFTVDDAGTIKLV
jgi:hypothetical protein